MSKIIIAGASVYGLKNASDDSMFHVFCNNLHIYVPDLEIVLFARHPNVDFDKKHDIRSIKNLDWDSKKDSTGKWFKGLNNNDSLKHLNQIYAELKSSDLLVIGGGPFIDISIGLYHGLTPYVTLMVTLAKFLNVPIMMNGIHLGRPLNTELGKEMARFCISNSEICTLREERSRKLFSDIGVPTDNMVTTSDAGFGIDPTSKENLLLGSSIINGTGLKRKSKYLIGITFRMMYWLWSEDEILNYASMVAGVVDKIIDNFDVDIIFIPHCYYDIDHYYEDDRPGMNKILDYMKNNDRAKVINEDLAYDDVLSVFPHLDFILGNRRHSVIFGAINKVPGIGIGEDWHVKPSMIELGIDPDLFVSMDDYSIDNIYNAFTRAWINRSNIKSTMLKNMPKLRNLAIENARIASKLILKKT